MYFAHDLLNHSAPPLVLYLFFCNATPTTEIYTLSLHDALPIWPSQVRVTVPPPDFATRTVGIGLRPPIATVRVAKSRSEEHTSELQSHHDLVCRLLLEKKKKQ